jgi:hypothetical protein
MIWADYLRDLVPFLLPFSPGLRSPTEQAAVRSPTSSREANDGLDLQDLKSLSDLRERQRIRMPEIAREITRRWISDVPSKMV